MVQKDTDALHAQVLAGAFTFHCSARYAAFAYCVFAPLKKQAMTPLKASEKNSRRWKEDTKSLKDILKIYKQDAIRTKGFLMIIG